MTISLEVLLQPAVTRDQFRRWYPGYSIALDGFVFGAPYLEKGPRRNFNHHEGVDRSCTLSTCEQARRAVLLGLYDMFRDKEGRPHATLYVNDCDQDVSLAAWVLTHPSFAAHPRVRQLCQINDLLDSSGGLFPMPQESRALREVAWVFEPYTKVRGELSSMTAMQHRSVIKHVWSRTWCFVDEKAEQLPETGAFVIRSEDRWSLVEVITPGYSVRPTLSGNGVVAAVEYGPEQDGKRTYSIWRRSEYVSWFPVTMVLQALTAEELRAGGSGAWGGCDNIGGSPRPGGSVLSPKQVQEVVDHVVQYHRLP